MKLIEEKCDLPLNFPILCVDDFVIAADLNLYANPLSFLNKKPASEGAKDAKDGKDKETEVRKPHLFAPAGNNSLMSPSDGKKDDMVAVDMAGSTDVMKDLDNLHLGGSNVPKDRGTKKESSDKKKEKSKHHHHHHHTKKTDKK